MVQTLPANQKRRILTLQAMTVFFLPLIFLTRQGFPLPEFVLDIVESVGILFIIAGVLGRLWSILYIGGRKNDEIITGGPYSLCRHPLYLFSTMSVFGVGLMFGSLTLVLLMTGITLIVLNDIAKKEELFLRSKFGESYDEYSKHTSRILPSISQFKTAEKITINVNVLRRNVVDALAFLALIPLVKMIVLFKEQQYWFTVTLY